MVPANSYISLPRSSGVHLVFAAGGVAGLPLDGVVAHLRRLLVLGDGVVGPADPHRVGGERHGLDTYGRNHGRGGVWDRGGEFIKQMEQIVIGWV